jgi:hypothetical protein
MPCAIRDAPRTVVEEKGTWIAISWNRFDGDGPIFSAGDFMVTSCGRVFDFGSL